MIMATSLAVLIGSIGGALLLIGLISLIVCLYISRCKKSSNQDSENGSSDPSNAVTTSETGPLTARNFNVEELEKATRHFDDSTLIGVGSFGLVYKGLLCDGSVVAVKKRIGNPKPEFVREAAHLSSIRHRNLVTLLGYCQEKGSQFLVFEFLPNGSISNHLYGKEGIKSKLEFKQRLPIAIGAAKGLAHLHGVQPSVMHRNFKTANVLVDENFMPKVADAGLSKLLLQENIEEEGASIAASSSSFNAFRDPALGLEDTFAEADDVYSFGIFMLELVYGKDATDEAEAFRSNESITKWVREKLSSDELVDRRMSGSFTAEGMRDFLRLMLKCLSFPGEDRPRMESVVSEIEQILEIEVSRTTVVGEGTTTVTLGSELFTN